MRWRVKDLNFMYLFRYARAWLLGEVDAFNKREGIFIIV